MDRFAIFHQRAPYLIRALMAHFPGLKDFQAAGVAGNLGHESNGLTELREKGQPEGYGGYGYAQWTGPRHRSFVAWCAANKLDWRSDAGNVGYLIHELKSDYAACIRALMHAENLEQAVVSFERTFERAGVVAMASRLHWAERALNAYRGR